MPNHVILIVRMDTSPKNNTIKIDTALYGPLAEYGGGKYVAQIDVELETGSQIQDLLRNLGIPHDEKGYLFINAVLCDAPGLSASLLEPLNDGDHVGIFSLQHMWPYQYRDGIRMSESLEKKLQEHGAMRNTY